MRKNYVVTVSLAIDLSAESEAEAEQLALSFIESNHYDTMHCINDIEVNEEYNGGHKKD